MLLGCMARLFQAGIVLVHSLFETRDQIFFVERLAEVAACPGTQHPVSGRLVGIGGYKDHRRAMTVRYQRQAKSTMSPKHRRERLVENNYLRKADVQVSSNNLHTIRIVREISVPQFDAPFNEHNVMSNLRIREFVWCLAFAGMLVPSIGQAQMMVEMPLVTCTQYLAMPPEQSSVFSAWMSGWFNQKTHYTYINLEAYARNVANVKAWCASNPGELVMTGLQRATGK